MNHDRFVNHILIFPSEKEGILAGYPPAIWSVKAELRQGRPAGFPKSIDAWYGCDAIDEATNLAGHS